MRDVVSCTTRSDDWRVRLDQRRTAKAKAVFPDYFDRDLREKQIAALPQKLWKGRPVFRLMCSRCGKERWEPEYVCWHLVSLDYHTCAWCLVRG